MDRKNYQGHLLFWWYKVICNNQDKDGTENSWRKVSEPWSHKTGNTMHKQLSPIAPFQPAPPALLRSPWGWVASWGPAEVAQRWPLGKEGSSSAMDPLQNSAESISKAGGISRAMHVKKGRKRQTGRGGNKRSEMQQREHQDQQRRRSFILEQISTLQPTENKARSDGYARWNCSQWRAVPGAEENHEEGREELLCTDQPLFPSMELEQGRGAGSEGVKLSLGKLGGKMWLYYLSLLLQLAETMLLTGD